MVKFFNRLILILFIVAAIGVTLLIVSGESHEKTVRRNMDETRATVSISGRFIEHLLAERVDKLYSVAYAGGAKEIMKSLVDYTDFVGNTYGYRGAFMVGLTDSGFHIVRSFNSTKKICGPDTIIDEAAAKRLLAGHIYVGPASAKCAAESPDKDSLMLIAVPIMGRDGFKGAVYELSTMTHYLETYGPGDYHTNSIATRMLVDDISHYRRGSEEYKLLALKNALHNRDTSLYNGRMVGFYSFYIQDTKLCLVYIKDLVKTGFAPSCCPWLGRYKVLIYISPLVLILIWIMLEIMNVNEKLGAEVKLRTRHLESLRNRYQWLFATIPEFVVLFRKDGEILECNGRFAGLLKGGNPVGANILYIIKEKDRFRQMLSAVKGEIITAMGEYLLSDVEELISVSVNACMVQVEGESAVLAVMTDITDYKKMQNSYYLAQKREAVGTLAAGMVHDFSNILQNIALQYSLLERTDEAGRDKNMKNIKKILEGANKYLTSVLSYTKDGKEEPYVKKGSEFVRNSLELLERVLPAAVEIEYEDTSGDLMIKSQQGRMTQMLINLCQNASDAMGGKGVISIRTYIQDKSFGHFFCLSVKDTGCGIPQENMDRIYKPFFTTKEGRGTGLGLATVRQIVVELGGFIEVSSTPDEGTEFLIMFSEIK